MTRHRAQTTKQADEDLQVLVPGDPNNAPEVQLEAVGESKIRGSALDHNPPSAEDAAAQAPERKLYRVVRGGMYADPNTRSRTQIRPGKEVDNVNYNIRDLQRQGIRLEKIEPGNEPLVDFVD